MYNVTLNGMATNINWNGKQLHIHGARSESAAISDRFACILRTITLKQIAQFIASITPFPIEIS